MRRVKRMRMPRKIRDLIQDLLDAGFTEMPGKRRRVDHRMFRFGNQTDTTVNLDGRSGDDVEHAEGNLSSPFTTEELAEASRYEIIIQWSDEDQLYLASVPELPGAKTHGDSPAEAATRVVEVAADWIYGSRQLGYEVPEPRKFGKA